MPKYIDARTGEQIAVGSDVRYGADEGYRVLAIKPGLLEVEFIIHNRRMDARQRVVGPMRYLHPRFMFQRVGFFPS